MADAPNWIAIRTAYVVTGWSAKKCAAEFKVNVTTIKLRASKENWTAERNPNPTRLGGEADKAALEAARAAVANAAKERAQTDSAIAETLRTLIKDSIDDLGKIEDLGSKIVARNQIMLMGQRFLTVNRIVRGIVPGQPSDTGDLDNPAMPTAPTRSDGDLDGDNTAAPMRRFVVKIHQPVLTLVPDQQAAG